LTAGTFRLITVKTLRASRRIASFPDFLSPSSFMIFQELIGVLISFKNYKIMPIEALHKNLKPYLLDCLLCLLIQLLRDF